MGLLQNVVGALTVLATSIAIISQTDFSGISYDSLTNELDLEELQCGLTSDFQNYLNMHGYATFRYERSEIKCGSYGGKKSPKQVMKKTPIVFIHGNSDIAIGKGAIDGYAPWQTGFRSLITYLQSKGYQKSQLYVTTWGPADPTQAQNNYHSYKTLAYLRNFIQAVIGYTKAPQIIIVSHSMGVTLARKAIQGGNGTDHVDGEFGIGPSLKDKVKAFIGLAGANYGLVACYDAWKLPTCDKTDGFYPGAIPSSGPAKYLEDLNANGGSQGQKVYTIWSKFDDLIGQECLVWGKVTCRIPNQTQEIVKDTAEWGHFQIRDNTGPDLIKWIE